MIDQLNVGDAVEVHMMLDGRRTSYRGDVTWTGTDRVGPWLLLRLRSGREVEVHGDQLIGYNALPGRVLGGW